MTVKKQDRSWQYWNGWLWMPVLMACALCVALFRGGGQQYWGPADSDLINTFYPWHAFIHRWLMRGVCPWWDPHVFGGYPTLETQQMLALNPIHLITLLLPAEVGLPAQIAAFTLLSAGGMGWALWKWGRCTKLAAAAGACVWTFGALFAVRVTAGHFTVVAGIAWWPLAALSVLRLSRSLPPGPGDTLKLRFLHSAKSTIALFRYNRNLRLLTALSAAVHAMVFLAGGPQYIIYLFYIDAAIAVAVARRGALGGLLLLLGLVWVLALVVSAPQWMPALWYLPFSARALSSNGATGLNFGPLQNIWLEMLMPYPFGDDLYNGHLHFKNVWETATYPGVLALVLSLAGVIRVAIWRAGSLAHRRSALRAGVTPLLVSGVLIVAIGFYMMIGGWLPGFGGFREATKARAVVAFGIAILSAAGVHHLARLHVAHRKSLLFSLVALGISLSLAAGFGQADQFKKLIESFGPPMDPQAGANYLAAINNPAQAAGRYISALYWSLAMLVAGAIAIVAYRRYTRPALITLVLMLAADPWLVHAPNWFARHRWEAAGIPSEILKIFEPKLEASRQAKELPWRVILPSWVINRTHFVDGLYEYHGYDPLMPARAANRLLVPGLTQVPNEDKFSQRPRILHSVGVRYDASYLDWREIADPKRPDNKIESMPGAALFEISRSVIPSAPPQGLFGPSLDGLHYVMPANMGEVHDEPEPPPSSFVDQVAAIANVATSDKLTTTNELLTPLINDRPDEFGVRAQLNQPAILFFKSTWLPGWRVTIDGKNSQVPMFANNWMCAAIVPAGSHDIVFRYRPVAWSWSIALSAAGCILLIFLVAYRPRHALALQQPPHQLP